MRDSYYDLILQTYYEHFPSEEFKVENDFLYFNGIPLKELIEQFGTPFKFTYLPKIGTQIQKAQSYFYEAIAKNEYQNGYEYYYCTKSSHFSHVIETAVKYGAFLETSSGYDIYIIEHLLATGKITNEFKVICNGFKNEFYAKSIMNLQKRGFKNIVPILDNKEEIVYYHDSADAPKEVGIRVAIDEKPNFEFYTSRLGIAPGEVLEFCRENFSSDDSPNLKILHFFINSGIKDTSYYWNELAEILDLYCILRKEFPSLDTLDIGGGFPIKTSLRFDYDYGMMAFYIIEKIKIVCDQNNVPHPKIISEFGNFTVGESGGIIYKVLNEKKQNDKELWYMIDSSFITTLPDLLAMNQRFITLPVNGWSQSYHKVNLGGATCDSLDYYVSEKNGSELIMPHIPESEPLFLGLFHTGAYQESVGGYGGIQHCLIPAPQHILIDEPYPGQYHYRQYAPGQSAESMLKILGYN